MARTLPAVAVAVIVALATPVHAGPRRTLVYALPEDRLEAFDFDVTQVVETEFTRLPPEAEGYDVDDLMSGLSRSESRANGRLERVVARAFRDGSLGVVTRVATIEGTNDRGEGPRPLELSALTGKSVSTRVLASGQIVDSSGWSHLLGAGGGGDLVLEPLLQSILRLPNTIPSDRPVEATWSLRLPVDGFLERVQQWTLRWTLAATPEDCRRCLALSYEGTIHEASEDTHPARPMSLEGDGTIQGTVVLGAGRHRLLRHRWSVHWTRTVSSHRANGTLRGALEQRIDSSGSLGAAP